MFGFLADKAKSASEAVGGALKVAGEKAGSIKDSVADGVGEGANVAFAYLEEHKESIQKVFTDGLIKVADDRLRDDEVFEYFADKAFLLLPAPIRLVLPRGAFMKHCNSHREAIILKIENRKLELQNESATEPVDLQPESCATEPAPKP